MKKTYTTGAQCLLFLAACLPAAPQAGVNPNHGSAGSSAQISASAKEVQVKALQRQLKSYEQQLRGKAEQVENTRQEAISAGIQGDGAGAFIDAYRQEQKELEELQAALAPQIERTRIVIANLTTAPPPSDTALSPHRTTRQTRTVAAPGNSGGSKQDKGRSLASNNSSKLNPAAK